MANLRLKCLFGVQDDLHDYAEAVRARLDEHLKAAPLSSLANEQWDCAVVHRAGQMQAEVIRIGPNERIPPHLHPHVDSIDLLVTGDIDLVISGKRVAEGYSSERRAAFLKRAGLRIAANAPHGGATLGEGVLYISCQRWAIPQSHIALAWAGAPCSESHARMLTTFDRIA